MRAYQCHKVVEAGKITDIARGQTSRLFFEDGDYADVTMEWMSRHKPVRGGYFVRYLDGYESYSPKHAFEVGYEPL